MKMLSVPARWPVRVRQRLLLAMLLLPALSGAEVAGETAQAAPPADVPAHAPAQHWSFKGPFGHFDLAAVQRGYAVFAGVCASCHSLTQVQFSDFGGIGLTQEQVAALAASWQVAAGQDAEGHLRHRKATPDDALPRPYADTDAARAANRGAVPPDLSRITQVYPGGADRVYALLTGYTAAKNSLTAAGAETHAALPEMGFATLMPSGTAPPCRRRCGTMPCCMRMVPSPPRSRKRGMSQPFWRGFPAACG